MITHWTPNVNTALAWGIEQMKQLVQDKRNIIAPRGMPTVEFSTPVTTIYYNPTERVLFSPTRDANPFFHFFEALWMLAGRNDVEFVSTFNRAIAQFSDDGIRIWGAYGWRWRSFFGFDQLLQVIGLLKIDEHSRRGVVAMWKPDGDAISLSSGGATEGGVTGKDVPCNTHLYFKIRHGQLNMTICNRSNDMLWGAYGANAVHMSMLLEYMANKLGLGVGRMYQMSDSLHVYLPPHKSGELWTKLAAANPLEFENRYRKMRPLSMDAHAPLWDRDLESFMQAASGGGSGIYREHFDTTFFKDVVVPLWRGFAQRSVAEVELCAAPDWREAAREWLQRRA